MMPAPAKRARPPSNAIVMDRRYGRCRLPCCASVNRICSVGMIEIFTPLLSLALCVCACAHGLQHPFPRGSVHV